MIRWRERIAIRKEDALLMSLGRRERMMGAVSSVRKGAEKHSKQIKGGITL